MALLGTFTKQPAEVLDYDIDYTEFLPITDTVASMVTTADTGITIGSTVITNAGKGVKVWVSGGTTGVTYKVQVRATSGDGRVIESEFKIKCKEV